jgi:hypothetical protein
MLRAYKVSCEDGDHGSLVVFAEKAIKVSRLANSDHCDCEFIGKHVHRAPAFDQYAPGPVTTRQYLAQGWYWPCSDCGEQLMFEDDPIITDNGSCYCDMDCLLKHLEFCKRFGHESWRVSQAAIERYIATTPPTTHDPTNKLRRN